MPRCSQLTVHGTPCRRNAMHGSDRCASHLGLTGPKLTLTGELIDQLVTILRAGNYIMVALRAVGINRRTYTEWMRRGRVAKDGDDIYVELRERVDQARAEGEVRNVAEIAKAARESWQAAAWLLERQFPDRWGRVSVRMREVVPAPEEPVPADPDDPFREVDELAEKRRHRQL